MISLILGTIYAIEPVLNALYPFQRDAVLACLAALEAGEHPVLALPTGSGKSHVLAALCAILPGRILVVTHRKELIRQDHAKHVGDDAGIYSAGLAVREPDARVVYAGIGSIYRRMDRLQVAGYFGYVLVDECFPAGTRVDDRPIETFAVGEYVTTWNHQCQVFERQRITAISKRYAHDLLTITLSSGRVVTCTRNHPFWTGTCYVPASELIERSALFFRDSEDLSVSLVSEGDPMECPGEAPTTFLPQEGVRLLCASLRECLAQRQCFEQNASPQSHACAYDTCTSQRDTAPFASSATSSRGQWTWIDTSTGDPPCPSGSSVGRRIDSPNLDSAWGGIKEWYMVQNRFSAPTSTLGRGNRRKKSSRSERQGQRHQEGYEVAGLRMDRIATIESAGTDSARGVLVYNFDVALNHNYFANDILVHNCHRVPVRSVPSMYAHVFAACPDAQRIGLTATPYRLQEGLLHEGKDRWFSALPVNLSIRALTPQYLSPLVGVLGAAEIDVREVKTRLGEYVTSELSQVACEEDAVEGAVTELVALASQRCRVLVFCVGLTHTRLVCATLQRKGQIAAMVVGATPGDERDTLLRDFACGRYKYLCNCEVLTTGYDAPDIDCVVLLRPTQSKGLVIQMLGRGSRKAPGKIDTLILDFAGNIERHQPLDALVSLRKSPAREAAEAEQAARADAAERARRVRHARSASLADPMGIRVDVASTYQVTGMTYKVVAARRFPGRHMLLACYHCPMRLAGRTLTQFVLLEHDGWAREQAEAWAYRRRIICPPKAWQLLSQAYGAPVPEEIVVREDAQWPRILIERFATAADETRACRATALA